MKRVVTLLLVFGLIFSFAGCSLFAKKEIPLDGFGIGDLAAGQMNFDGSDGTSATLDFIEVEIDTPAEITLPLPDIKGLAADVSSSSLVASSLSGNLLTVTGRAFTEGERVTVTLTAPKYEDASYSFLVGVRLHKMGLEILAPGTEVLADGTKIHPTTGGAAYDPDGPVSLTEGESVTLPLAYQEGAALSVTDLFAEEALVEAAVEDGNLVIKALKPGETVLTLNATHEPTYEPVEEKLVVIVTPKPVVVPKAPAPANSGAGQVANRTVNNAAYLDLINDIIYYTNIERQDAGLAPLTHLTAVDVPAALRAEEADEYWSHTRPNGEMFNTIFGECGLRYSHMGENLYAINMYPTAEQVVAAWMSSPDHRENILRDTFDGIGVGVYKGGEYWCFCQLFVKK